MLWAVIPRLGPEKSELRVCCWPRGLGTVARGTQDTVRAHYMYFEVVLNILVVSFSWVHDIV